MTTKRHCYINDPLFPQARDLSSQLAANVGSTVHIQGAPHAQIVHHGGNAYLVQSTGRIEDESPNPSHTTKASPVTVMTFTGHRDEILPRLSPRFRYNGYVTITKPLMGSACPDRLSTIIICSTANKRNSNP